MFLESKSSKLETLKLHKSREVGPRVSTGHSRYRRASPHWRWRAARPWTSPCPLVFQPWRPGGAGLEPGINEAFFSEPTPGPSSLGAPRHVRAHTAELPTGETLTAGLREPTGVAAALIGIVQPESGRLPGAASRLLLVNRTSGFLADLKPGCSPVWCWRDTADTSEPNPGAPPPSTAVFRVTDAGHHSEETQNLRLPRKRLISHNTLQLRLRLI